MWAIGLSAWHKEKKIYKEKRRGHPLDTTIECRMQLLLYNMLLEFFSFSKMTGKREWGRKIYNSCLSNYCEIKP
jgi:hypothetical protein